VSGRLYSLIRPLLFSLPAEQSHRLVGTGLRLAASLPGLGRLVTDALTVDDPRLATEVFGLRFSNPVGLAAGWDKDARYVRGLPLLGFGYAELGTVTPRPQPGNPRPRVFRLPSERALINRIGFTNQGAAAMARRLGALRAEGIFPMPIGVNLGKNRSTPLHRAVDDYLACLGPLHPYADYLVVNVSSPNTPGLRDLQAPAMLGRLLGEVVPRVRSLDRESGGPPTPVLVKFSPDEPLEELPAMVEAARRAGVNGFIAINTTRERTGIPERWREVEGGLSGPPLRSAGVRFVARLWELVGREIPIIGVGGVSGPEDAWALIRAGASLVQVYTGMIYEGPALIRHICAGLARRLESEGFGRVADAVGTGHGSQLRGSA